MMAQDLEQMTFEDLSSAYRVEMKSQILAEVRKDLYPTLAKLQDVTQKNYEAEYSKNPDSITCEGMNERRKKVNNLIQKVVDLRMEKVMMMALRASMGANNPIDRLTPEEREYYDRVADSAKKYRNAVLRDRTKRNYVIPDIAPAADEKPPVAAVQNAAPVAEIMENEGVELIERPRTDDEERPDLLVIRILEDLPNIAGPDCDYNLKKEDIVRMPAALANVLINHEKAVLLNVTP